MAFDIEKFDIIINGILNGEKGFKKGTPDRTKKETYELALRMQKKYGVERTFRTIRQLVEEINNSIATVIESQKRATREKCFKASMQIIERWNHNDFT